MQVYLTPKDIAQRLQISIDTARNEMRKMRHKPIGTHGQMLRVTEQDFEDYMKPDPPLPRPEGRRYKSIAKVEHPERIIQYRKRGDETT